MKKKHIGTPYKLTETLVDQASSWIIDEKIKQITVEIRGDAKKPKQIYIEIFVGDQMKQITFIPDRVGYLTDDLGFVYKSRKLLENKEANK